MTTRSGEALASVLRDRLRGRVVLIGVGNPLRGDDGVGSYIARGLMRELEMRGETESVVLDAEDVPESWIGPAIAARPDIVLIVDAAELNAPIGSAVLLGAAALQERAIATHRTPLGPLAAVLYYETNATVLFLGVQPSTERWGSRLSADVVAIADWLIEELADILAPPVGVASGKDHRGTSTS